MKGRLGYLAIILLIFCSACSDQTKSSYQIVLDPGHGGEDAGATSVSGQHEKDFNLNLALKVKEQLEQDERITVFLTREDDRYLALEDRQSSNFAKNADALISIHANAFDDSSVSGTETFYYRKKSRTLAETIHNYLVEATGFNNRGVQQENFFVLKDNKIPAVLLEIGFLTNPEEASDMFTESFQERVAEAVATGVQAYLFD